MNGENWKPQERSCEQNYSLQYIPTGHTSQQEELCKHVCEKEKSFATIRESGRKDSVNASLQRAHLTQLKRENNLQDHSILSVSAGRGGRAGQSKAGVTRSPAPTHTVLPGPDSISHPQLPLAAPKPPQELKANSNPHPNPGLLLPHVDRGL